MVTEGENANSAALSLTPHELIYMFNLEETDISASNCQRLGLPAPMDSPDMVGAGASTLLVRGLAYVDRGALTLTRESGLVGFVVTHAATWTEVGLSASGLAGGTLMLTAEGLTLALMPRALGVYEAVFVQPGVSRATFVRGLVEPFVDAGDDRMVVVRSSDGSESRSGAVVRTGGTRWRMADYVPTGLAGVELSERDLTDSTRSQALEMLAEVPW